MHLKKEKLAALCRECGPHLHVPQGIDGAQLLWACAGGESSFGAAPPGRITFGYVLVRFASLPMPKCCEP
jgi:hypothetical protein